MDPVMMIVAAMAAGASAGLTETTSTAVTDAYRHLRDRLLRRFTAGGADAADALVAYERDPAGSEDRLAALVAATGSDRDAELVAAARRLLELAEAAGPSAGKYNVDLRAAKGVVVGDRNTQTNHF